VPKKKEKHKSWEGPFGWWNWLQFISRFEPEDTSSRQTQRRSVLNFCVLKQ